MLDRACYCALPGMMEHWRAVIKVAFTGAGSVEFTRNVVTDLCSSPELTGRRHFAVHDISCRDHVYQAAPLDPNTAATLTVDQTVAMCDDLLEAHRGGAAAGAAALTRLYPCLAHTARE
jgi:alpha-galactosidase/6-phospho-beta-glucosidase family protein